MNAKNMIAAIAVAAACGTVYADTVDVKYLRTGAGRTIKFDLNGSRQNVFAGQLEHRFSNGTGIGANLNGDILTYCTDLMEYVSGSTSTFDVVDPANAPATPMGPTRADALRDLYTFAAGSQLARGADSDYAAAFQLAVWEVVYDFDTNAGRSSLDIESGAFESYRTNGWSLSSSIRNHLDDLFDAIGNVAARGDGMDLYAVVNDGKQDQLVELAMQAVPLPSVAGMGFAGLLGVAGTRRRR